jgi:hypothetical protein
MTAFNALTCLISKEVKYRKPLFYFLQYFSYDSLFIQVFTIKILDLKL